MKLTKHELSIGESLHYAMSKHDLPKREAWMERNTPELFRLANLGLQLEAKLAEEFGVKKENH